MAFTMCLVFLISFFINLQYLFVSVISTLIFSRSLIKDIEPWLLGLHPTRNNAFEDSLRVVRSERIAFMPLPLLLCQKMILTKQNALFARLLMKSLERSCRAARTNRP